MCFLADGIATVMQWRHSRCGNRAMTALDKAERRGVRSRLRRASTSTERTGTPSLRAPTRSAQRPTCFSPGWLLPCYLAFPAQQ
uniref:Uncharacterized protein n=1 Tax=Arundo donax TaxID=35708 RepID=A0A0A9EQU9_ARUDO